MTDYHQDKLAMMMILDKNIEIYKVYNQTYQDHLSLLCIIMNPLLKEIFEVINAAHSLMPLVCMRSSAKKDTLSKLCQIGGFSWL